MVSVVNAVLVLSLPPVICQMLQFFCVSLFLCNFLINFMYKICYYGVFTNMSKDYDECCFYDFATSTSSNFAECYERLLRNIDCLLRRQCTGSVVDKQGAAKVVSFVVVAAVVIVVVALMAMMIVDDDGVLAKSCRHLLRNIDKWLRVQCTSDQFVAVAVAVVALMLFLLLLLFVSVFLNFL